MSYFLGQGGHILLLFFLLRILVTLLFNLSLIFFGTASFEFAVHRDALIFLPKSPFQVFDLACFFSNWFYFIVGITCMTFVHLIWKSRKGCDCHVLMVWEKQNLQAFGFPVLLPCCMMCAMRGCSWTSDEMLSFEFECIVN